MVLHPIPRPATGLFLAVLLSACAPQPGAPRHEQVLDNGLRVVVQEDHRSPVVVSQLWYKVGGSYEPAGQTGISHVLEHMMFKGTETLGPGEFSRIIAAEGGRENAFTGRDYTAYFQTLERSRLEVAFRLEADRMRHLKLNEDEFQKERQVVMEERRLRTEDRPENLTYERFMHAAFGTHPYGQPIIGWRKDLEALTLADLKQWYRRWYAPDNATLVVVGDVEPRVVFDLARKHYGPLAPSRVRPPARPAPPALAGPRRITVARPARVPYLIMGYLVPSAAAPSGPAWEPWALEVLGNLLAADESARLPKALVRGAELAARVAVGYDWGARLTTLFMIDANPAPGHDLDELERAIIGQLDMLKAQPVPERELQRVKKRLIAQDVFERDSVFYQAMKIGQLVTVGLPVELVEGSLERIRAVTAQQVQAVARKYLVAERLTVARLTPLPLPGAPPPPGPAGGGRDALR